MRAARAALTARIDELESSPLSSAIEMFKRSYYATGVGRPALGTAASVANVSSRDMTDFFQHAYRRAGLSASAVGGLSPELGRAIKALASVLGALIASLVRRIEKVETAVEPKFQAHFVEAMAIPHNSAPYPHLASVVTLPAAEPVEARGRSGRRRARAAEG